ncbi:MAG: HD domain-containing phosphohydrolase [Chloroflexota bacterium]
MQQEKVKILVVADARSNSAIAAMLRPLGYEVILASDGEEALARTQDITPHVILLNIALPETNSLEVTKRLKQAEASRLIPVILMTSHEEAEERLRALEAGVDDFLTKPVDAAELQARVKSLLKVKAYNDHISHYQQEVETEVARRTQSLAKALEKIKIGSLDTVYRLSRAAEYKDEDTGAHVQRMSHYSSAIARAIGSDDDFVESVLWAAPMHDVGKIGIPDRILQKPGKLEPDEWVIMRQHTTIGAEILKDASADFIKLAEAIALSHHEKWDGSGYPRGMKGEDIPLAGRIVALADVFDALTSDRVYRAAMPLEKAMGIVKEGRGSHFDPAVVDAFASIETEITKELNWWKFLSAPDNPPELDLSELFREQP